MGCPGCEPWRTGWPARRGGSISGQGSFHPTIPIAELWRGAGWVARRARLGDQPLPPAQDGSRPSPRRRPSPLVWLCWPQTGAGPPTAPDRHWTAKLNGLLGHPECAPPLWGPVPAAGTRTYRGPRPRCRPTAPGNGWAEPTQAMAACRDRSLRLRTSSRPVAACSATGTSPVTGFHNSAISILCNLPVSPLEPPRPCTPCSCPCSSPAVRSRSSPAARRKPRQQHPWRPRPRRATPSPPRRRLSRPRPPAQPTHRNLQPCPPSPPATTN